MSDIHALLLHLEISPSSRSFLQIAYALSLIQKDPDRLHHITKYLYPDVAKHFHTSASCVERNIRAAAAYAWSYNSKLLIEMSCGFLKDRPTASEFLAVLMLNLSE